MPGPIAWALAYRPGCSGRVTRRSKPAWRACNSLRRMSMSNTLAPSRGTSRPFLTLVTYVQPASSSLILWQAVPACGAMSCPFTLGIFGG